MTSEPENSLDGHAVTLMGGADVLGPIETALDLHLALQAGLPASAWVQLRSHLSFAGPRFVEFLGSAPREGSRLSRLRSNRVWTFARLLARATDVLGGPAAAVDWLARPAMALERRRPVDLLTTCVGRRMVEDHLTRMDLGVHT